MRNCQYVGTCSVKLPLTSWRQSQHRHLKPRLPLETGQQTSPVSVGLQSDWGWNSNHLFMATNLHGKWLINAGAWIIVRSSPIPHLHEQRMCVYYLSHKLPRDFCFCVSHFCFILRVQLPLLPTPRVVLFFSQQFCVLGTVCEKV